jgi:hypothetical protein
LTTLARRAAVTPATMGDILAVLGLGDPGVADALIGAWDRLLAAIRPDLVIAEFAPALAMAAYGRMPVLTLGTGFSQPPSHLPRFPSLTGRPTVTAEAPLLDVVNHALARHGCPRRETLPGIFLADREFAAVFTELDPYRPWRSSALGAPSVMMTDHVVDGEGDELFVYMNGREARPNAFWQGLARSGLKVRIHDPSLTAGDSEILSRAGLSVEPKPVPFARIAGRSRLLLSHGGLGFVSSALLAGLPQVVLPFDIEKRMIAASISELDLGRSLPLDRVEAGRLAALLRAAFEDVDLIARARAAAAGFRARIRVDHNIEAADAVEALLA